MKLRPRYFWLALYSLTLFCTLYLSSYFATRDDLSRITSLSALTPIAEILNSLGENLLPQTKNYVLALALFIILVCLLFSLLKPKECKLEYSANIFVAFALAILAQIFLILHFPTIGTLLYLSLACLLILMAKPKLSSIERQEPDFDKYDYIYLSLITLIAIFLRFYALNRVLNYFEGELSPYFVGALTLKGTLNANIGYLGPWAPLGYLYYLPIYLATKLFGVSILSIRIASAVPSILSVCLLYALMRFLFSRSAAVLASFFLALDPLQIGWGRSDIHPHGSTVQLAILLCALTYYAFRIPSLIALTCLSLLMGLCAHQYPSGQAAVAIPPLFLTYCLFAGRDHPRHIKILPRHFIFTGLGTLIWVLGFPLQYALFYGSWTFPDLRTIFGARTSWHEVYDQNNWEIAQHIIRKVVSNSVDLIAGIFYQIRYMFHQSFIPEYPDLSIRTIIWLMPPFILVLFPLCIKKIDYRLSLLFIWAFCGALPSVFSELAFEKRAAIMYPALYAIGSLGLVTLNSRLESFIPRRLWQLLFACLCFCYLSVVSYQWFSGKRYEYGEPIEISISKELGDKAIKPGNIIVLDFGNHYLQGKFTFLLIDSLLKPEKFPVAWYMLNSQNITVNTIFTQPQKVIEQLPHSFWYHWSDLSQHLKELQNSSNWSRIILFSQTDCGTDMAEGIKERFKRAVELCGSNGQTYKIGAPSGASHFDLLDCRIAPKGQ